MLKLKKIYLLVLAFCLSTGVFAQKDKQAREVLDKTAAAMKKCRRNTCCIRWYIQRYITAKRRTILFEQRRCTKLV